MGTVARPAGPILALLALPDLILVPAPGLGLLFLLPTDPVSALAPCVDILCDDNSEMVAARHAFRRQRRPLQSFSMLAHRHSPRSLS